MAALGLGRQPIGIVELAGNQRVDTAANGIDFRAQHVVIGFIGGKAAAVDQRLQSRTDTVVDGGIELGIQRNHFS